MPSDCCTEVTLSDALNEIVGSWQVIIVLRGTPIPQECLLCNLTPYCMVLIGLSLDSCLGFLNTQRT